MILKVGTKVLWGALLLAIVTVPLAVLWSPWWWLAEIVLVPLVLVGLWDFTQKRHSILRNYPIIGHFRFLLEDMGPELHQYLVEDNTSGRPFDRDTRSIIYRRAKNVADTKPFGTEQDVYAEGYTYLKHSIVTRPVAEDPVRDLRITVGGPACTQPYSLSVFNISAMSFGALGGNAVHAMNTGAKLGNFAHDTGEGGISRYHRAGGGDLIWQIGTGYFGCRKQDGTFDPELFRKNAGDAQVKMIEIKLSQGAKPGHGGILPGPKVTEEIAEARLVEVGKSVFSPTSHTAFSTPLELVAFVAQLRELSGGKPVGFKICIGEPREFIAIVKAMLETGIMADFIVVDGGRGRHGRGPAGVLRFDGLAADGRARDRAQHARRCRDPRARQGRCERQDGHRVRDRTRDGARRRLVQLGARLHVLGRLHPGAAVQHESLPGRRHLPGSEAAACARRPRQGRARPPLPPQHRARARGVRRGDGPRPPAASSRRTTSCGG